MTGLPNIRTRWRRNGLAATGIVYYFERRSDGAIKIGCTKSYDSRRQTLTRQHGALSLIAYERGYYAEEAVRHEQFAHLRLDPVAEWFRPGEDLVDHVLMLLAIHA
jgi:hypothetical protein